MLSMIQIYQPAEEEEVVKVSDDSKEDKMREYEKAALCLAKAKLVCSLISRSFHH